MRPLRDRAGAGDILLFQCRADASDRFRLILIRQGTPEFGEIARLAGARRWGALYAANPPVTQAQLSRARDELAELAQQPFALHRPGIPRVETRQNRIARDTAFRVMVRWQYARRCAISGIGVATPSRECEVESAHVVPLEEGGTDDIRNGLALAQTVHWAFDRGLLGVLPNRTVYVPRAVRRMPENAFLLQFEQRPLAEARDAHLKVHPDALAWHFENRVRRWD